MRFPIRIDIAGLKYHYTSSLYDFDSGCAVVPLILIGSLLLLFLF